MSDDDGTVDIGSQAELFLAGHRYATRDPAGSERLSRSIVDVLAASTDIITSIGYCRVCGSTAWPRGHSACGGAAQVADPDPQVCCMTCRARLDRCRCVEETDA